MTSKDYIALAKALNESYPAIVSASDIDARQNGTREGFSFAVQAIVPVMVRDNPRFDVDRFLAAVYNG